MPQAARLAFEEERYKDEPDPSVAFDYAMELVKSPKDENKELGIVLLNGPGTGRAARPGHSPGRRRGADPPAAARADLIDDGHRTKDCLVAIARAELDLGRFSSSRRCVERVLKRDPTHEEALALHHEVRTAVRRGAHPRRLPAGEIAGRTCLRGWGPPLRSCAVPLTPSLLRRCKDGPTGLLVAAGVTVAGFLLVRRLLQSRESHNT